MLEEIPTRRAAYIGGDESASVIPVTVVLCAAAGLVTGELAIPRDCWEPWLFLRFLQEQDERLSA